MELRREAILEKQKKSEEVRLKKQKLLEQYTQAIVEHGLWQIEEEVDCNVDDYTSNTEKITVLKIQLRFRDHVLGQTPEDKSLFSFSKKCGSKCVQLKAPELKHTLKQLLLHASSLPRDSQEHMLVGKRIRHRCCEGPNVF